MKSSTTTRRGLLRAAGAAATLLAAPVILSRRAQAAEFEFKMATTILPDHPLNARAREAAAAILEQSKGRVAIQVFPGYQLGGNSAVLSQVRGGGIDIATFSGGVLSTLVPISTLYNVAFAFADSAQVFAAMDGRMGDMIRSTIEKSGLHPLNRQWNLGFRQVTTSSRPINTPADLKGLKLRVPVAPLFVSAFKALDAAPAPINFDELYTALQTNVVEGEENDLYQIQAGRLYEVQKYCSMTSHIWDGYYTLLNAKVWRGLPADLQDIVAEQFNAAAVRQRADVETKMVAARQALGSGGLVFNEIDRGAFKAKLSQAGFYAEWRKTFGDEAWGLLEAAVGPLK